MAPHSSILAWKIPWTEKPGRLQSMGSLGVGYNWATSLSLFTFMHWRRKWQPTPVFLLSMGSHRVGHDWRDLAAAAAAAHTSVCWCCDGLMSFTFWNRKRFCQDKYCFKSVVRLTVGHSMFNPECLIFNGIGSVWLKATKLLLYPRIYFTFEICSIFDYQGVFNDSVLSPWLDIPLFHSLKVGSIQCTIYFTYHLHVC